MVCGVVCTCPVMVVVGGGGGGDQTGGRAGTGFYFAVLCGLLLYILEDVDQVGVRGFCPGQVCKDEYSRRLWLRRLLLRAELVLRPAPWLPRGQCHGDSIECAR
jgi:hypothetical protein